MNFCFQAVTLTEIALHFFLVEVQVCLFFTKGRALISPPPNSVSPIKNTDFFEDSNVNPICKDVYSMTYLSAKMLQIPLWSWTSYTI